jgi:hypothetical protein
METIKPSDIGIATYIAVLNENGDDIAESGLADFVKCFGVPLSSTLRSMMVKDTQSNRLVLQKMIDHLDSITPLSRWTISTQSVATTIAPHVKFQLISLFMIQITVPASK